jgi:uncharacterized C2H2 Zn-finger protein
MTSKKCCNQQQFQLKKQLETKLFKPNTNAKLDIDLNSKSASNKVDLSQKQKNTQPSSLLKTVNDYEIGEVIKLSPLAKNKQTPDLNSNSKLDPSTGNLEAIMAAQAFLNYGNNPNSNGSNNSPLSHQVSNLLMKQEPLNPLAATSLLANPLFSQNGANNGMFNDEMGVFRQALASAAAAAAFGQKQAQNPFELLNLLQMQQHQQSQYANLMSLANGSSSSNNNNSANNPMQMWLNYLRNLNSFSLFNNSSVNSSPSSSLCSSSSSSSSSSTSSQSSTQGLNGKASTNLVMPSAMLKNNSVSPLSQLNSNSSTSGSNNNQMDSLKRKLSKVDKLEDKASSNGPKKRNIDRSSNSPSLSSTSSTISSLSSASSASLSKANNNFSINSLTSASSPKPNMHNHELLNNMQPLDLSLKKKSKQPDEQAKLNPMPFLNTNSLNESQFRQVEEILNAANKLASFNTDMKDFKHFLTNKKVQLDDKPNNSSKLANNKKQEEHNGSKRKPARKVEANESELNENLEVSNNEFEGEELNVDHVNESLNQTNINHKLSFEDNYHYWNRDNLSYNSNSLSSPEHSLNGYETNNNSGFGENGEIGVVAKKGKKGKVAKKGDVNSPASNSAGSSRKSWKNHIVQGSDMYACDQCDKMFSKQSSLARHKYEHSGIRPFVCDICKKAFKHKHHLAEHKRLHTGEKPFECGKCGKRFSHSGSYSQHMNHRYKYCRPYKEEQQLNQLNQVSENDGEQKYNDNEEVEQDKELENEQELEVAQDEENGFNNEWNSNNEEELEDVVDDEEEKLIESLKDDY